MVRVLEAPVVCQVEAATPVRFNAPAEVTASVPEVVVDRVRAPEVELIVLTPAPATSIALPVPAFEIEKTLPDDPPED